MNRKRTKNHPFQLNEDRAILMVCFVIALIFWLIVKLSNPYKTTREVEFYVPLPQDKALSKRPPDDMTVELSGLGWDLAIDYFYHKTIKLVLPLNGTEEMTLNINQLRHEIKQYLRSDGIAIGEINYDQVTLKAEDKLSRKVPIALSADLAFAPDFHLKQAPILKPDSVEVSGPASLVKAITFWASDSIRLTDLKSNVRTNLKLKSPDYALELNTPTVQMQLEVEPFTEKSLFVPLKIVHKSGTDSIRIFPENITVQFKLGLSRFDSIQPKDFQAEVDFTGISKSSSNQTAPIQIVKQPASIQLLGFTPKSVKFFWIEE
ncbi:MAG TPA: CdaR family protein [Saprospiraceae bacterium]|nr:CdaR family protein [Saprospiraceae bacterium]HMQ81818.1 CdaR family protein [Saprospiraceae bacterium]